jgi:tagatose-1,6-bisphosphate aldolase non-catalytic subunit AgaZ/GatZ
MTSISQTEIDQLILSFAKADWRKTAFIIARVLHDCEDKNIEIKDEEIADRIATLCNAGRLESQGVLSNWRGSELRLPL